MKKILESDIVKTRRGTCDFCGKEGEFIAGSPIGVAIATYDGHEEILDDWEYATLSQKKIVVESHYQDIYKPEQTKIYPLICFDCIKDFSKFKQK